MSTSLVLCIFEQLSKLKNNFHESEINCFGNAKEIEDQYRQLFGCESATLPFKYLGIPIYFQKLKNGEWKPIENCFEVKLSSWIGKLLSYGERLVLGSYVTSNIYVVLSRNSGGGFKATQFFQITFFWQSDGHKTKYRLTK
jgi:hypothetical protein